MGYWFVLPLVSWGLTAVAWATADREYRGDPQRWGRAMVRASLLALMWVWVGTEMLSIGHWLTRVGVAAWWVGGCVLAASGCIAAARWRTPPSDSANAATSARAGTPTRVDRVFTAIAWAMVLALLGLALWVGAAAPPNNGDSLDYHLPRQHSWMQNATVAYFDTNDTRMLAMPPLAEYAQVHLQLLSGTDRVCFLVSWLGLAVAAVGAALATRELAGTRAQAALAALLAVTTPCGLMLASTPKNDCVVAGGVGMSAWILARVWRRGRFTWLDAIEAGLTLGALALTKGTGLLYAGVLGVFLAGAAIRAAYTGRGENPWGRALGRAAVRLACVGILVGAINAPQWARNAALFGSPIASGEAKSDWGLKNQIHTPAALASNLLRNAMLHAPLPWERWNRALAGADAWAHRRLDLAIDDPRTTYFACPKGPLHQFGALQENSAGAPVHLIGALLAAVLVWWRPWGARASWLVAFMLLVALSLVLKWQYWHPRFHIAVFVAFAPSAAIVMGGRVPRWGLLIGAAGLALYAALWNMTRPTIHDRPFHERSDLALALWDDASRVEDLEQAASVVESMRPRVVGAFTGTDAPLHAVMRRLEALPSRPLVVNFRWDGKLTGVIRPPTPDVVVLPGNGTSHFIDAVSGTRFVLRGSFQRLRVYGRDPNQVKGPGVNSGTPQR